jgi:hypothetical protein
LKTIKKALTQEEKKPVKKKSKIAPTKAKKDKTLSKNNKDIEQVQVLNKEISDEKPLDEVIKKPVESVDIKTEEVPAAENLQSQDDEFLFEKQPQFDMQNPKIWNGNNNVEPVFPERRNNFQKGKPKFWNKNKSKFFGKKRPEIRTESKPLIWRENSGDPVEKTYQKPFGEHKNKFGKKVNPKFFKKKKTGTWEDRKPKFWNEGKPNSRLNQK